MKIIRNKKFVSGTIVSFIALGILVSLVPSVLAIGAGAGPVEVRGRLSIGARNIGSISDLIQILIALIKWTYTVFFIVAVLFILIAAYNFLRGGDNPKAVETAKAQLKYAVIAIVVALLASGAAVILGMVIASRGAV